MSASGEYPFHSWEDPRDPMPGYGGYPAENPHSRVDPHDYHDYREYQQDLARAHYADGMDIARRASQAGYRGASAGLAAEEDDDFLFFLGG